MDEAAAFVVGKNQDELDVVGETEEPRAERAAKRVGIECDDLDARERTEDREQALSRGVDATLERPGVHAA